MKIDLLCEIFPSDSVSFETGGDTVEIVMGNEAVFVSSREAVEELCDALTEWLERNV